MHHGLGGSFIRKFLDMIIVLVPIPAETPRINLTSKFLHLGCHKQIVFCEHHDDGNLERELLFKTQDGKSRRRYSMSTYHCECGHVEILRLLVRKLVLQHEGFQRTT